MINKIVKYSNYDLLLVSLACLQGLCNIFWLTHYQEWHWSQNFIAFVICSYFIHYNVLIISHNHIHCPFFKNKKANDLFTLFNSSNLFLPLILFRVHHLVHHRYSNDTCNKQEKAKDLSSTYLHGKNEMHEHILKYVLLSYFRQVRIMIRMPRILKKRNQLKIFYQQIFLILSVAAIYVYIDWKWFFFLYLPSYYIGWSLSHLENYYEHFRATNPNNQFANSVSYYGKLYNRLTCNEAYHQEHHIEPFRHWSQRHLTRKKFRKEMEASNTYIAHVPNLFGFLEPLFTKKSQIFKEHA